MELKKQASALVPQVTLSEFADSHVEKWTQVPTFDVVIFASGVKAHYPSMPFPKQASLAVYLEHVDHGIQFIPLETHLTPVIALEHNKLDVNNESVHSLKLQWLD